MLYTRKELKASIEFNDQQIPLERYMHKYSQGELKKT